MNPYDMAPGLYVDPDSRAWRWVNSQPVTPDRWLIKSQIAMKPMAKWIGPGDPSWVGGYLSDAARQQLLPVLVAYAIPFRDVGQHSAGGLGSVEAYMQWATKLAKVIGPKPCVVILEPDTLIHMPALTEARRADRCAMLSHAVHTLTRHAPNTYVYLDGGDGGWTSPVVLAPWLARSGVAGARGVAVNVSNFNTTDTCVRHAEGIKAELKRFGLDDVGYVIDTSRNGNGPDAAGTWCNPPRRKLGQTPLIRPGSGADAHLWIKHPGESDGNCGVGVGTQSGQFVPDLALRLIAGR
ncbi:glycoside hydrolase family 6 protein [Crossiella sp. CA-258035]|uniref:glycoside hydrolase family 6 protein n=1 Tax=Crossiella sp. CA-258035 TaxID=2981138 RepID=UPI0024BBEC67|nr:glycoside hydrolase family 6 protein [Crossiella sp. CA-258035]WHT21005.1 glycoside hydrolase family 6 protein [Crossiella sp. CA-258035]